MDNFKTDNFKTAPKIAKNLIPAYMAKIRVKGLCYFCDEPFTQTHSLTHKKFQKHVLEMNDDGELQSSDSEMHATDADMKEPKTSINALTGVADFSTMRITGYHNKRPIHVLIDSGSTHNFLDINVAKKFG